jgi:hypothetical protein
VYQAAFREVARETGYDIEQIAKTIVEAFREKIVEDEGGYLDALLREVTEGEASEQDSRFQGDRLSLL